MTGWVRHREVATRSGLVPDRLMWAADLGDERFDGAWLVENVENLMPESLWVEICEPLSRRRNSDRFANAERVVGGKVTKAIECLRRRETGSGRKTLPRRSMASILGREGATERPCAEALASFSSTRYFFLAIGQQLRRGAP